MLLLTTTVIETFHADASPPGRRLTRETEYPNLVALYEATGGNQMPGWRRSNGWTQGFACAGSAPFYPTPNWHGVSGCSRGEVVRLDLRENWLRGTLPSQVGTLTSLTCEYEDRRNPHAEAHAEPA